MAETSPRAGESAASSPSHRSFSDSRSQDLIEFFRLDAKFYPSDSGLGETHEKAQVPPNSSRVKKKTAVKKWKRVRMLNSTATSSVWLEECPGSDYNQRAVKEISKRPRPFLRANIDYGKELAALCQMNKYYHLFVNLLGWFDSSDRIFLCLEYFPLGDLANFVSKILQERDVQLIAEQLVEGLDVLHRHGWAHRDLKPENVYVVQSRPDWVVKIGDFGISKRIGISSDDRMETMVGTPNFAAPEIIPGVLAENSHGAVYTSMVDLWSLGALVYSLLTDRVPFSSTPDLRHYCRLVAPFPSEPMLEKGISEHGLDFVEALLDPNPSKRLSAANALNHPWLKAIGNSQEDFQSPVIDLSESSFRPSSSKAEVADDKSTSESPQETPQGPEEEKQNQHSAGTNSALQAAPLISKETKPRGSEGFHKENLSSSREVDSSKPDDADVTKFAQENAELPTRKTTRFASELSLEPSSKIEQTETPRSRRLMTPKEDSLAQREPPSTSRSSTRSKPSRGLANRSPASTIKPKRDDRQGVLRPQSLHLRSESHDLGTRNPTPYLYNSRELSTRSGRRADTGSDTTPADEREDLKPNTDSTSRVATSPGRALENKEPESQSQNHTTRSKTYQGNPEYPQYYVNAYPIPSSQYMQGNVRQLLPPPPQFSTIQPGDPADNGNLPWNQISQASGFIPNTTQIRESQNHLKTASSAETRNDEKVKSAEFAQLLLTVRQEQESRFTALLKEQEEKFITLLKGNEAETDNLAEIRKLGERAKETARELESNLQEVAAMPREHGAVADIQNMQVSSAPESSRKAPIERPKGSSLKGQESQAHVILIDERGRSILLPYSKCRTWFGIQSFVQQAFRHYRDASASITAGHWDLKDRHDQVILPEAWEDIVAPGIRINVEVYPLGEISDEEASEGISEMREVRHLTEEDQDASEEVNVARKPRRLPNVEEESTNEVDEGSEYDREASEGGRMASPDLLPSHLTPKSKRDKPPASVSGSDISNTSVDNVSTFDHTVDIRGRRSSADLNTIDRGLSMNTTADTQTEMEMDIPPAQKNLFWEITQYASIFKQAREACSRTYALAQEVLPVPRIAVPGLKILFILGVLLHLDMLLYLFKAD